MSQFPGSYDETVAEPEASHAELLPGQEECPACGSVLDVEGVQPLASITCPHCQKTFKALRNFGSLVLQQLIGFGGSGLVYSALDTSLERLVALKILRGHPSDIEKGQDQLAKEATNMASVNEPHVVQVYSTGTEHGHFYISMEILLGGSLQDVIDREGSIGELRALNIGLQAALGLKAVNDGYGMLHCDVKPANILFTEDFTAKIADFGLALFGFDAGAPCASSDVVGSPYYISPERASGEPEDIRSDIYSLGATLYHAIAGQPPFQAPSPLLIALKRLNSPPVRLKTYVSAVSAPTVFCVGKMLARNPDDRFQTYDELIEHLRFALDHGRHRNAPVRVVVETEQEKKARGWLVMSTLSVAVALGGFFFLQARGLVRPAAPICQILNPSFESPELTPKSAQITPTQGAWIFNGTSGTAANGSEVTKANTPAPDGEQVAFLCQTDLFYQTINGLIPGTTYIVQFLAAQRNAPQKAQTWELLAGDNAVIASFAPPQSTCLYWKYAARFVATEPSVKLIFQGTNVNLGENVVLIDNVRISPAPSVKSKTLIAPTALSADAPSPGAVHLNWKTQGTGELGFELERKIEGNSEFKVLATVPGTWNSVPDFTAKPGIKYTYRVRSLYASGVSAPSPEATAQAASDPSPPVESK